MSLHILLCDEMPWDLNNYLNALVFYLAFRNHSKSKFDLNWDWF
jgi:hypothetical protein